MTERLAYSIKEVAAQVGVSKDTVKRAIARERLPVVKFGRLTRIRSQDVEEWILAGMSVGRNKAQANK
jgi:excisionase family DNA binding protein